jgi:hypothetical protein
MMQKTILLSAALAVLFVGASPAMAGTGDMGRTSQATGQGSQGMGGLVSAFTNAQRTRMAPTMLGGLASGGRGLPKTTLDSFVYDAMGSAEAIYGDEGAEGLPPYFGFTQEHRIARGINSGGLTTNHGSYLPNAWGGDEWTGAEFSNSGPSAQPSMPVYIPPQNASTLVPPSFPFDVSQMASVNQGANF